MKNYFLRVVTLILCLACCMALSCCDDGEPSNSASTDNGQSDTHGTDANTDKWIDKGPSIDEEPEPEEEILELKWNLGYVASSSHGTKPNQLVSGSGGGNYSYTDVFTVPKAGTTVTFTDDNSNSGTDAKFSSTSAYVVSSWKKEGSEWVLDLDGANYAGSNTNTSDILISYKNGAVTYSYTTTLDNENLRLCFRSGHTSTFTPSAFPVVTATVTGNRGTAADKLMLNSWIEESKSGFYSEALKGKTVYAIGDSYFEGNGLLSDYVWLNIMAKKYGIDMHNYGKNGSTVSNYVTNCNPVCDRYTSMSSGSPDIVLLEGGRNDFNKKVPIGTVDSTDTKTYSGALNVIIDGLQAKYPNAMIVCVTPWNFPDKGEYTLTYADYAGAMEAVAEAQGVYCIKAYDPQVSGVNMRDASFKSQYCMKPTDVSHLNLEGMKIALSHFEKILDGMYVQYKTNKNT